MNGAAIEARVNGEPRTLPLGTCIGDLVLDLVGADGQRGVAVARNGAVLARSEWEQTRVESGDEIEIVHPIQGG